jgi:hypothetical protein
MTHHFYTGTPASSPGTSRQDAKLANKSLRAFASLREAYFDAFWAFKNLLAKVPGTVTVIVSVWITSLFQDMENLQVNVVQ